MTYSELTKYLLSLPGAQLSIQWGDDHIFKVGGKMFAGMGPATRKPHGISFKADEMGFHVLTRRRGITPARYLARAQWVALDRFNRLPDKQLKAYLERAHRIVAAALPKRTRVALGLREADG